MNIVFVSTMAGSAWGGSEELWAAAARESLRQGHRVHISLFDWGSLPAQVVALQADGAEVVLRERRPSRLKSLIATPSWLKRLEDFAPDVVCVSQGSAYECVARRPTRPLFRWLASTRTPMINLVQYNTASAGRSSRTIALARRFYNLAIENLFVAARNIDEARDFLGRPVPRARVVRNPVNLTDTSALPWPSGDVPRLATVARLSARPKGQDILLSVLGRPHWKSRSWQLSLVGTGPYETLFRKQAADLGIADRVVFTGQLSDMRRLWSTHHALVLPSLAEGTPLAMVEAMLLARPVIVTDVGGCADWVINGENGWLAPHPTADAIDATLHTAFENLPRWPQVAQAARARALTLVDHNPGATLLTALELAAAQQPSKKARSLRLRLRPTPPHIEPGVANSNVLLLANPVGPGGMLGYMIDLCESLVSMGHRCVLLTPSTPAIEESRTKFEAFATLRTPARLTRSIIHETVREFDIDWIKLCTGAYPPDTRLAVRMLGLSQPVVETLHLVPRFDWVRMHRWIFYHIRPKNRYRLVALTPVVSKTIRARLPALAPSVRELPSGISLTSFKNGHPRAAREPRVRFVTATRLTEKVKDVTNLLHAVRIVRESGHPLASQVTLSIFGEGHDRAKLEHLAAQLQIERAVRFEGWSTNLAEELPRFDVFVLSSRREVFGRVNVEAAAIGLPVIASDIAGCQESVGRDVNGLLVRPADPRALADAMLKLMSDTELADRLAAAGPAFASRFDIAQHTRKLLELVEEMK